MNSESALLTEFDDSFMINQLDDCLYPAANPDANKITEEVPVVQPKKRRAKFGTLDSSEMTKTELKMVFS